MKNSDEAIDRLLAGLREIDTPPGMNHRLLYNLEQRTSASSRRPAQAGWALASACALAGLLAIAFHFRHQAVPTPAKPLAASMPSSPVTLRQAALLPRQKSALAKPILTIRLPAVVAFIPPSLPQVQESNPNALDAAYAPSQLAPPMPLTEQEKLLLRITHRSDAIEVAMLASAEWKTPADAEFDRFFAPPAVPIPAVPIPAVPTETAPTNAKPEATDKVQGDTP